MVGCIEMDCGIKSSTKKISITNNLKKNQKNMMINKSVDKKYYLYEFSPELVLSFQSYSINIICMHHMLK